MNKIEPGDICRCGNGIIGIVLRQSAVSSIYYGKTLDGKPWQSMSPTFVAKSINEHIFSKNDIDELCDIDD